MIERIILTHAADTKALAEIAVRRLAGVGVPVERRAIETLNGAAAEADRLIVLWSRGAASAEASLKRAEERGKLNIARLASAPTPPRLRAHVVPMPRPRDSDETWRAFAGGVRPEAKPEPQREVRADPGTGWHALLVAALMSLVVAGAAYGANADFAARVNALFSG